MFPEMVTHCLLVLASLCTRFDAVGEVFRLARHREEATGLGDNKDVIVLMQNHEPRMRGGGIGQVYPLLFPS